MNDLDTFLWLIPLLLASLVLHELAHAVVATKLGDPTPREQGRLTLNPIPHLDPLGTAMFAVTYFTSGFLFGWARPVLVDARRFRHPKEGMALVAVAGPATNFLLALVCVGVLVHVELSARAFDVLEQAFFVNVVLGIFNLIPIPPLDGSRIVGAALRSDAAYMRWASFDQYGMFVLFGLIILFQQEFSTLMNSVYGHTARAMVRIVGG
ncbi:MAG TPA: site-2 protease family protein [Gaiellaceae bacterium]|jgi:Zn-dependent protease